MEKLAGGEVVGNPDDRFPKHQDDQGGQPFQQVGEDNRPVPGVLAGETGGDLTDDDPGQGHGNPHGVGEESPPISRVTVRRPRIPLKVRTICWSTWLVAWW